MKAIRIVKCSDSMMWYKDYVGKIVPLLREDDVEYLSREPTGYSNIVRKGDCELVDVPHDHVLYTAM